MADAAKGASHFYFYFMSMSVSVRLLSVRSIFLLSEHDLSGRRIHALDDRQRFNADSLVAYQLASGLLSLLDDDADAFNGCPGRPDQFDQSVHSTAVRKEVINNQDVIFAAQELGGDDYIIGSLMGKGLYLCHIHRTVQIDTLCLLGKYDRHVEVLGNDSGNTDPGCFDRQNLVDRAVGKQAPELLAHLIEKCHVHLMVEKAVYLKDITFFDNSHPTEAVSVTYSASVPAVISASVSAAVTSASVETSSVSTVSSSAASVSVLSGAT